MRLGLAADSQSEFDPNAFHFIFLSLLRRYQNTYYQSHLGLLPDAQWEGLRASLARYVGQPGFRSWWRGNTELFNKDFRKFIDEMSKSACCGQPFLLMRCLQPIRRASERRSRLSPTIKRRGCCCRYWASG